MTSIESMVDVNTIIGESIVAPDGSVIIPLSKVCFGFAAGGSEFNTNKIGKFSENTKLPFGGGSGAGVHISPVGFLVMKDGNARVLNVNGINVIDRAVDMIPDLINKIDGIINKKMDKEAKEKETIQPEVSPDDME
jgi:sporulation protein YtfJ